MPRLAAPTLATLRGIMPPRGMAAVDCAALAHTVSVIGQLMLARPELGEADINPLVVYPKGDGVVAIDASLVAAAHRSEAE